MKTLLVACLTIPLLGCQTLTTSSQPAFSGGDGSSSQQAVHISNVQFHETGFVAERMWLARQYPGYREVQQSALKDGNRHFDLIELTSADGQPHKVYFDSSDFFGR